MKRILLVISLIYVLLNILYAQPGSRFQIDTTSVWRIDHIRNGVSDEKNHEEGDEIYKYFIHGDTIIESKTYFKVYKTGTAYYDAPFYYENVYAGAIRDENNKFFFVKKDENYEVLLYDFNVKIDDTIQVPYSGTFIEKVVSSIDTLLDGRRLIHFNPREPVIGCGDQYMIEGIGGSGGLLEGPACFHFWTSDNHLVCYVQNGYLVYHDNNFEFNCEIVSDPGSEAYFDSTCVWRIDKQAATDIGSNFEKLAYFIRGDTIINTKPYWKLYKNGYQLYIDENNEITSVFNDSVYMGAIRESDHRIYFIETDKATEDLLYNFNLQLQDKVDGKIFIGDTVHAIETILDNRKFFYTSESTWENYFMEGIGSDKGLLENGDEHSMLICFMRNNASLYHNGNGSECNLNYDEITFSECDKLRISPASPTVNDEIKIILRECYQVSYNHPEYPVITDNILNNNENSIIIEQYYDYNDQSNADNIKILHPVFDTIVIGNLNAGDYFVELIVHTIHHGDDYTDTTFYNKSQYQSFTVSQSTSRFPIDPLARWKISEISFYIEIEGSYEKINEKYEYFIDSDTTIHSQKYYKLFKSGVAYYDTPFYYEKVYAGAIRDDDNRFYMVRKDQDAEVLLIDFNLELGDTIRAEIGNGNIINNIEILADGRKCISSIPEICGGCCSTITLLEGIGHSGGIMENPPCYHIGYYGHYLNCYEINGELIYQTDIPLVVDCENFFSSLDDLPDVPNVKIYPVPATDILSVDLLNMPDKQYFISIFNITGSLILTREIQSNHTDIDIQHLEKGIYLVRIYNEVTSNVYKLIVE